MKKAIIYRRVSTSEQGKTGNGLLAQKQEVENWCKSKGYTIAEDFEEVASGGNGIERRPQLAKALKLSAKLNAPIVVNKIDRLSRDVLLVVTLMKANQKFIVTSLGEDADEFTTQLFAILAQKERKLISERTRAGLESVKAKGKKLGMHNPKVYASNFKATINSAKAVKAEADSFAQHIRPVIERMRKVGMSTNSIAAELNQQGNKTARGGSWYASTVCNVMKRLGIN